VSVTIVADGTVNNNGQMDVDNSDGNDDGLLNGIVRNNDYIIYNLEWQGETTGEATAVVELPVGMEWDASALQGAVMPGSLISPDGRTLTAIRNVTANSSASVNLSARVYNHKNGDVVTLVSASIGGVSDADVSDTAVTVSAAPNYVLSFTNASFNQGYDGNGPNHGTGNNFSGELGLRPHVGIEIYALSDSIKGVKGIASVDTFTFNLSATSGIAHYAVGYGISHSSLTMVPSQALADDNRGSWSCSDLGVEPTLHYTITGANTTFRNPAPTQNINGTTVSPTDAYFICASAIQTWIPVTNLTSNGSAPTPNSFTLVSTTVGVSSGNTPPTDTNYGDDGIRNTYSDNLRAISNTITAFSLIYGVTGENLTLHKGETFRGESRVMTQGLTQTQTNTVLISTWDDSVDYDIRGSVSSSSGHLGATYYYGYTDTPSNAGSIIWYNTPAEAIAANGRINAVKAGGGSINPSSSASLYIPLVVKADTVSSGTELRYFYSSNETTTPLSGNRIFTINPASIYVDLDWEHDTSGPVQTPGITQILHFTPWVAGNNSGSYASRSYLTPTTGTATNLTATVTIPDSINLSVDEDALRAELRSHSRYSSADVDVNDTGVNTVITFTLGAQTGSGPLDTIDIPVTVDLSTPTSAPSVLATAVISSPSDTINETYRTATSSIAFNRLNEFAVQKTANPGSVQPGGTVAWTLRYANYSTSVVNNLKLVDVLPYNGDARGTTGLTTPLVLKQGSVTGTWEYTTDSPGAVITQLESDATGNTGINWTNALPAPSNVTALRFNIANIAKDGEGSVSFETAVGKIAYNGELDNDVYAKADSLAPLIGAAGIEVKSSASEVKGKVWKDLDFSDSYTDTTDDSLVSGVTVTLAPKASDTALNTLFTSLFGSASLTTVTNTSGEYSFTGLPIGDYTVSIPTQTGYTFIDPTGTNTHSFTVPVSSEVVEDFGLQATITPDAINDTALVATGGSVEVDVLANDTVTTSVVGDDESLIPTPTVTSFTQPSHGVVTITAGGITFDAVGGTPVPGAGGNYTFTYTITDSQGHSDTATVTITVSPDLRVLTYSLNTLDPTAAFPAGGSATDDLASGVQIINATHYGQIPTRTGYTFGGWYLDDTTSTAVGNTVMPIGTQTIHAKWNLNKYSVTFVAGIGGSLTGTTTFADIDHGTTWSAAGITVPTVVPESDHYSFTEWTEAIPTGNPVITANLTFTANFAVDSHSVSYNGNGHSSGNIPTMVIKTHGQTVSVASGDGLSKIGYTLIGWSEDATAVTASYVPASTITNIDRDYSLHAVWSKTPYTVSYAAGGSKVTGLPSGATQYMDDSYTVSSNIPERIGYTFNGWVATSGISGNYSGGANFTMPAANVVLTANWTVIPPEPPIVSDDEDTDDDNDDDIIVNPPVTYTVAYNSNGATSGNVPTDGAKYESGHTANILGNSGILERTGYRFMGWALNASATSAVYTGGESLTITANVTLYAVWEPVTATKVVSEPKEPEAPNAVNTTFETPKQKLVLGAKDKGIPVLPGGVPLYGPKGFDTWSLLDLILAILGVIFTAITIIGAVSRGRRDEDRLKDQAYEDGAEKKNRIGFIILMSLFAVGSVILFVLTQDVNLPMVLIDNWTIVFAVVFVAQIVCRSISKKYEKDDEAVVA
jgi:uncharacterized repeat protein (TIGR02543 family)